MQKNIKTFGIFIIAALFLCTSRIASEARTYQFYSDSLNISFNALRRADAEDFTGILLHIESGDHKVKEILLDWNSEARRVRLTLVNGLDINTFDICNMEWPQRPEHIRISATLFFRTDMAVIRIGEGQVIIDKPGLSLNTGYDITVLPSLSIRPDPNIPAIVEYTDMERHSPENRKTHKTWIWLLLIIVYDIVLSIFVLKRQKRKSMTAVTPQEGIISPRLTTPHLKQLPDRSAILFFGGFRVYDSEGEDISRLFSPMLRELLALIIVNSSGKGITSGSLKDELWPDKDLKSARNNRSVYMRKLRSLLDKVGPYNLELESGYWIFGTDGIFVDYMEFLSVKNMPVTYETAQELMSIVQRGPLLPDMDFPWTDQFKAETADAVINILEAIASGPQCEKRTEFALTLANTIERFDALNEKALHLKCRAYIISGRHSSAKGAYDQFIVNYRDIYGDNFQYDFNQLANTPAGSL